MALAESRFTEPSSQMRTLRLSTARRVFSLWPTLERTRTVPNSLSPPLLPDISTASTLSSAKSLRVTKLSRQLRTFQRVQETSQRVPSRSPKVASCRCQKKVSTWSYKVLSFSQKCLHIPYSCCGFEILDMLIVCSRFSDEYGHAEFQPGQEEPVEVPIVAETSSAAAPAKTEAAAPVVPVIPSTPEIDAEADAVEGYSILQKGVFFAFIMGVFVVYLRMSNKKSKRFTEKSMV